MLVSAVVWLVTAPVVLFDDVPEGLDRWERALGAIGGRPVEVAAVVVSACLFLLGAVASWLLRRREAVHARGTQLPGILGDMRHSSGCPRDPSRMETWTKLRERDGIEVAVGKCNDCGRMAYRHGDAPASPPRTASPAPSAQALSAAAPEDPRLRSVRDELVAVIDESDNVRTGNLGVDYGRYTIWREKAAAFIETVLGATERQRFGQPVAPAKPSLNGNLCDRLTRLADLRDRPNTWEVQVDADGLARAIKQRRALSEADRIVTANQRAG
jgi:hypothetical protein